MSLEKYKRRNASVAWKGTCSLDFGQSLHILPIKCTKKDVCKRPAKFGIQLRQGDFARACRYLGGGFALRSINQPGLNHGLMELQRSAISPKRLTIQTRIFPLCHAPNIHSLLKVPRDAPYKCRGYKKLNTKGIEKLIGSNVEFLFTVAPRLKISIYWRLPSSRCAQKAQAGGRQSG